MVPHSLCYKKTKACVNVDLSEIRKKNSLKNLRYEIDPKTG